MATEENIAHFSGITGADPEQARFYLDAANGDVETAISTFYDAAPAARVGVGGAGQGLGADERDDDDDGDDEMADAGAPAASAHDDLAEAIKQSMATASVPSGSDSASAGFAVAGAGNTLSGAPAPPMPSGWGRAGGSGNTSGSSTPRNPMRSNAAPRVTGFRDLASSAAVPQRQSADDEDSDDDDDDEGKDQLEFFTGGEKSGLAVENPNAKRGPQTTDMIKGILQKAKEGGTRMAGMSPTPPSQSRSVFTGSAHTLGSDETPSTYIPDPTNQPPPTRVPGAFPGAGAEEAEQKPEDMEVAVRNLTFWSDGFSVEDGDLMRYDDPANQPILAALNAGRAPLSLLNVRFDQQVELRIAKRTNEKWTRQPKPPAGPFEGSGHRLGSTSGPDVTFSSSSSIPAVPVPATRAPLNATVFEVDASQPTTNLQIRLRDGTRMVARFNHTHTVGDVRRYINNSNPGQSASNYALQTTFPSRDLTDDSQTIKDANLLGSVIVQRGL